MSEKDVEHIATEQIWNFVHSSFARFDELTLDQHTHLQQCQQCLDAFRLCVLCDSAAEADTNLRKKKAAA